MADSWTLVYAGNYSSVLANQATLEASGIETYIPDSTTKVVDPVITGGACLDAELHVHTSDVDQAAGILNTRIENPERGPTTAEFIQSDPVTRNVLIGFGLIIAAVVLFLVIAELAGFGMYSGAG